MKKRYRKEEGQGKAFDKSSCLEAKIEVALY